MLLKVLRLATGLLCGILMVNWISAIVPLRPNDFVGKFILNPVEFLAGTMALVFGMYANGGLIRNGVISIINTQQGKKGMVSDIILAGACVVCIILLLPFGIWQTTVFFVFCLLYGMMSFSPPGDGDGN